MARKHYHVEVRNRRGSLVDCEGMFTTMSAAGARAEECRDQQRADNRELFAEYERAMARTCYDDDDDDIDAIPVLVQYRYTFTPAACTVPLRDCVIEA